MSLVLVHPPKDRKCAMKCISPGPKSGQGVAVWGCVELGHVGWEFEVHCGMEGN